MRALCLCIEALSRIDNGRSSEVKEQMLYEQKQRDQRPSYLNLGTRPSFETGIYRLGNSDVFELGRCQAQRN